MTTVFGLRHPEVEMGVLVADRQTTSLDSATGMPLGKHLGRKLWKSNDGLYCFGHSGGRDPKTEEFFANLVEGKYDLEEVISKGHFAELRAMNIEKLGNTLPDVQKMSGLILLTRFGKNPMLYTCFPLGEVLERGWTAIGSGDQKITEYMNALEVLSEAKNYIEDTSRIAAEDIIRVGLEAVRRSQSQDLYSQGLDMMVCTPDKIRDHYADLDDDFGKKLAKIQKKYSK